MVSRFPSPTLGLQPTGELGSPILPAMQMPFLGNTDQQRGSDLHLALCGECLHPVLVEGDFGSQS